MFIQVIEGRVSDGAGLEAALDRWEHEVRPGAVGFLGSTGGITDDGRFLVMARFATADDARANSERPEQSDWWSSAERCFAGPVDFHDCSDVDVYRAGGTDAATFVQVMQGHAERERIRRLDADVEEHLGRFRPDLLGSVRAWDGDLYTEAAYFTSEADARAAESQPPPPDLAAAFRDWQAAMGEVTYFDLTHPHLVS